jgi:putative FmdB family regulatory protein
LPTYQYACTECGHEFDTVQSFSDASLTECPQCTGKLRKVFNAVGIVFKGSGFYRTDSRSSAAAGSTSSGESGDKVAATKEAGAKDAKATPAGKDSGSSTSTSSGSSSSGSSSSSSSSGSSSTKGSAA